MDRFLLIIGAMKSGTTSLFRYLAEHPQILRSSPKEPNFFANDENWALGMQWYKGLWEFDPQQHRYAMEASTAYTKLPIFPNAAERIATVPAQFKFIYIMRNPIDRIESHYTHGRSEGWETRTNQNGFVALDEEMIQVSKYAEQLDQYYNRFSSDDIKLLIYEDLISRPKEIVNEICTFLDLEPTLNFDRVGIAYNRNQHRPTNQLIRRLRWSSAGRAVWEALPLDLAKRLRATVGHNPKGNFKLAPPQREEVLEHLLPDLQRLKTVYNVDTSSWGIDP